MYVSEVSDFRMDMRHGAHRRTPGVHLSQIIKLLGLRIGKFTKDDEAEELLNWSNTGNFPIASVLRMVLGLAWEDWISCQIPDLIYHYGEEETDGIIGTPDAVLLTDSGPEIHEFKLTWKSAKRDPGNDWAWVVQLKGYCKMLGTTRACLWVYYVNGDYTWSGPVFRCFRFEFTEKEIEENWRMLRRHRDQVEPETGTEEEQETITLEDR
jgi:hypothetical protein